MKLRFTGDIAAIEGGLAEIGPMLGVEIAPDGLPVAVERVDDDRVEVTKRNDGATIRYRKPNQFFRALGLLTEGLAQGGDLDIVETARFDMVGPMIDVSQGNAVPTVETVKRMLRRMAVMGLDMYMLYAEDSYEVPERPWFGYMRGRYSADQTREIDDYAAMLGIEVIPCIQTLGHLFEVLKWDAFADLRDDDWSLLVGYEPTYQFVEEMIRAASDPVRTKRIHIGMDEAWGIGQGRSVILNGWRPKFELMTEHLERVLEITRRLGLQPMMWGDMFFRALSPTNSYRDVTIPPELARSVPQDVELIYWDYYEADPSRYVDLIRSHKALNGEPPIFGGGIWNWRPWSLNYGYTFAATNAALAACKQEGVREIIATTWGDDGTECDLDAVMLGLQLFAEHCYHDEPSQDDVFRRFRACVGADPADFWELRRIDETPGVEENNTRCVNPSRYLLWQNPLMGLFDRNVAGIDFDDYYRQLGQRMGEAATRNGEYDAMFDVYEKLCDVLAVKSELGIRLTDAYRRGDRDALRQLAERDMPEAIRRAQVLRGAHRQRWHELYQPFGWEVIDGRYGLLVGGIDTAIWRVRDYLDGRVDRIEELEAERMPYQGREGLIPVSYAGRIQSGSRLVWYEG